jgi:hypothetical protein
MKTKILSILALISISILLTGCTPKNKEGGTITTNETNQEENLKGSLFDIVKLGKNVKCTFSAEDESGKTSGTTYVSGGKARSDFSITNPDGEKLDSYTISDADWIYLWGSQSEQGTKMKVSELPKNEDTGKVTDPKAYEGFNNAFDYKCSPWIPDGSKFNVPTNIVFTDFTDMMKNIQAETDKLKEGLKGMCGTCDMAGDATKIAECKTNLGCE